MNWPSQNRWLALWQTAGATKAPVGSYERLADAYAEPHRHYHNQRHIAECLDEFDQARHLTQQPAAVELALWFHDAVYDPKAGDNEEQSAALAQGYLTEAGINGVIIGQITNFIMATKNHGVGSNTDAAVLVDVDLSILGRDQERFLEYETGIRREYAWVPAPVFATKRSEILRNFLGRERIFATQWFGDKYEKQARLNLAESVKRLRCLIPP